MAARTAALRETKPLARSFARCGLPKSRSRQVWQPTGPIRRRGAEKSGRGPKNSPADRRFQDVDPQIRGAGRVEGTTPRRQPRPLEPPPFLAETQRERALDELEKNHFRRVGLPRPELQDAAV